jgi:3-dehydroquinate synthase
MIHHRAIYSQASTDIYFDADFEFLKTIAPTENSFIVTDDNLMLHYQDMFKPWKCIVIPAGEASKSLAILDDVVRELIALEADRNATIIGIGGGVVTDIAGFVAGIYKRGVKCILIPTSILAMVDAAIGGKNGLDIGVYKNMMGLIRQPNAILYHYPILQTLPHEEWVNGFAEIIKHACIHDVALFEILEQHSLPYFQSNEQALAQLIYTNILIKLAYVCADEFETGNRKHLNFGHTLAHAIENYYALPHGHAVAIGMQFAALVSASELGFGQSMRLQNILARYELPHSFAFDAERVLQLMLADKKRTQQTLSYILLQELGTVVVKELTFPTLKKYLLHEHGN